MAENRKWAISPRLKLALILTLLLITLQYILLPLARWQAEVVERAAGLYGAVKYKTLLIDDDGKLNERLAQSVRIHEQLRDRYPVLTDPQSLQLSLQKTIEGLTNQLNIRIVNVNWMPVATGHMVRAPVRFRLETPPDLFVQLLHKIETAPHFMSVDGVRITTSGNRSPNLTAEIDISAYAISDTGGEDA